MITIFFLSNTCTINKHQRQDGTEMFKHNESWEKKKWTEGRIEASVGQKWRAVSFFFFSFSPSSQNSCHSEGRAWVGWWLHFLLRSRRSALIAHQAARPFRSRLLFFRPLTWIASNVLQTCKREKKKKENICVPSQSAAHLCVLPRVCRVHQNAIRLYSTMSCPWCFFFIPTLLFFVFVFLSRNAVLSVITEFFSSSLFTTAMK